MANLITEKQKKVIKLDYIIRYISVLFFMLSLLGLFFLAYVIPYYFSVMKKDLQVAEQFKSVIVVENKENTGESSNQIVNQTLNQLRAIDLYSQKTFIPSTYFSRIINSKNANISLTKLSFNLIKKDLGQLLISGVAKNREGLVTFIEDLKIKGNFIKIEYPISDFAKDRDISFTLNIQEIMP